MEPIPEGTVEERMNWAMSHVMRERKIAIRTHGLLTRDSLRAAAILSEEVGEVAQATLNLTKARAFSAAGPVGVRNGADRPIDQCDDTRITAALTAQLRRELAQVAAVALLWLENLEDEP